VSNVLPMGNSSICVGFGNHYLHGEEVEETPASGCFDFACAHCGGKIRWAGTLDDNPPCPRCGEYLPTDTIDQAKVLLEQIEAEATEEHTKKPIEILHEKNYDFLITGEPTERLGEKPDMPCVQYPGGDYDHDELDIEGE